MIKAIKKFFDENIQSAPVKNAPSLQHQLQLATAALLIEMTRVDNEVKPEERRKVIEAVRTKFDLGAGETESLMELAETEADEATDYHQFTSLINKGFTAEQKKQVVEYLWQVAYADGELDKYERHLVQKIADLLYVPHKVYIAAKERARSASIKTPPE